jgi:X-X-X-Leu-X-X-Gly heptad repeat protein
MALALLLVASLLPVVNLAGGFPTSALAEEAGRQTTADAADAAGTAGAAGAVGTEDAGATGAAATSDAASGTAAAGTTTTGTPATVEDRQEVIYGLLDGTGAPRSGYVVNHFQIKEAGTLDDQGDYSSVKNLTSTAALTLSGRRISGMVDAGDFYYEGTLGAVQLPWLVDIAYTLDGNKIEPEQLAGGTGKLGIHIKTQKNATIDPVFFENYLLQIQLTLDADKVKEVSAPDATIASAGKNQQVVFTVLPHHEGDLRLEAQVSDFEMPGIQISALPFSMVFDIPDTSAMMADMTTLSDAIGELNEGVRKLNDGVKDMEGGAATLKSGSNDLNAGLTLLSGNSTHLTAASSQVDGALRAIAEQLEGGSIDPAQIQLLVDGLRQLSAGLYSGSALQPGLAEGLTQVQGGITQATTALNSLIGGLAPTTNEAAIGTLRGELGNLTQGSQDTVNALINTNTQAITVQGAWYYGPNGNDGIKAGLESASTGLGQFIASCQYMAGELDTIASGLEASLSSIAGLQVLTTSMRELSNGYSDLNAGLASYAGGVDTLAQNYAAFNSGLAQLLGGVSNLREGTSGLYSGTTELHANVKDLPETMQKEIDSFLKDYQASDFTPVSFVSTNSEHLSRVQFILITDPIKVKASDEPSASDSDKPAEQTFWDRLVALFS